MRIHETIILLGLATIIAGPVRAQTAPSLTPDQKSYIAYHQCMLHAAITASHSDAPDSAIFGLARAKCAPTRAAVLAGQENNTHYLAALDAADAEKQAHFPDWIKGVRERRKAFGASATPSAAH